MRAPSLGRVAVLLACGFALIGCAEGTGLGKVSGIAGPLEIDFGEVRVGALASRTLSLRSKLTEDAALVAELDDAALMLGRVPGVIGAGASLSVELVFAPRETGPVEGALRLQAGDAAPWVVRVTGRGVRPEVSLEVAGPRCDGRAGTLDLGVVRTGSTVVARARVTVTGSGVAQFAGVRWAMPADVLQIEGLPDTLAAGQSAELRIIYRPEVSGPASGRAWIEHDSGPDLELELCGRATRARLCLAPTAVEVGPLDLDRTARVELEARSCGEEPLRLRGAEATTSGAVDVAVEATPSTLLAPGEVAILPVVVQPIRTSTAWEAEVVVSSGGEGAAVQTAVLRGSVRLPCVLRSSWSHLRSRGYLPTDVAPHRAFTLINEGPGDCVVTEVPREGVVIHEPRRARVPITLRPAQRLDVEVSFRVLSRTATVTFPTLGGGQLDVPVDVGRDALQIAPMHADFGLVYPGAPLTRHLVISNVLGGLAKIEPRVRTAPDPRLQVVLPPDQWMRPRTSREAATTATITVTLDRSRVGRVREVLQIGTDSPLGDIEVLIAADVVEQTLCVSSTVVEVDADQSGAIELEACGSMPVEVSGWRWEHPHPELDWASPPPARVTLAPGDRARLDVRYRPRDGIPDQALLRFDASDPASPTAVRFVGRPRSAETRAALYAVRTPPFGPSEVVRAPLDGRAPATALYTFEPRGVAPASLSPDGRYLLYLPRDGTRAVLREVASGAEVATGVDTEWLGTVSWRPSVASGDTSTYAFAYGTDAGALATYALDGTRRVLLEPAPGDFYRAPAWGPDGTIAVVRAHDLARVGSYAGQGEIVLVPETGGAPTVLASAPMVIRPTSLSFSPDGRWLAFLDLWTPASDPAPEDALRAIRTDGSAIIAAFPRANAPPGARGISVRGTGEWRPPAWTRDGRALVFTTNRRGTEPNSNTWTDNPWSPDLFLTQFDPATGVDSSAVPLGGVNTEASETVLGIVDAP